MTTTFHALSAKAAHVVQDAIRQCETEAHAAFVDRYPSGRFTCGAEELSGTWEIVGIAWRHPYHRLEIAFKQEGWEGCHVLSAREFDEMVGEGHLTYLPA